MYTVLEYYNFACTIITLCFDKIELIYIKSKTNAFKNLIQDAGDFAMVAYFVLKNRCPEKGRFVELLRMLDCLDSMYVLFKTRVGVFYQI